MILHMKMTIALAPMWAFMAASAFASSGTVAHLSGTLAVKKADGSMRILAQKSEIESGDTLLTERDTYARIRFSDGAQITLKPNTALRIDSFSFAQNKPADDAFVLSLLKGGLRAVTGTVGKRSGDKYELKTASATIRVHGTTFAADDCVTSRAAECHRLDAAVYVSVADGEVTVRNPQGEVGLAAGQFGAVAPNQRPLFLSTDPGLQFTPPPTFIQSVMAGAVVNTGRSLECVITR